MHTPMHMCMVCAWPICLTGMGKPLSAALTATARNASNLSLAWIIVTSINEHAKTDILGHSYSPQPKGRRPSLHDTALDLAVLAYEWCDHIILVFDLQHMESHCTLTPKITPKITPNITPNITPKKSGTSSSSSLMRACSCAIRRQSSTTCTCRHI